MNPAMVASSPEAIKALGEMQMRSYKMIGYALLAVVLLIVLVIFWRKIASWVSRAADVTNNKLLAASIVESKLTHPKAQYGLFADRLFSAMDGMGTDEEEIYQVFRAMETYDDVSQLIVAFGTREITDPRPWYSNKTLTLQGALKEELDSNEIKKVNMILAGKNINYIF